MAGWHDLVEGEEVRDAETVVLEHEGGELKTADRTRTAWWTRRRRRRDGGGVTQHRCEGHSRRMARLSGGAKDARGRQA